LFHNTYIIAKTEGFVNSFFEISVFSFNGMLYRIQNPANDKIRHKNFCKSSFQTNGNLL
jgi:hypothetical protein